MLLLCCAAAVLLLHCCCALCLPTTANVSGSRSFVVRSFGLKDGMRVVLGLPALSAHSQCLPLNSMVHVHGLGALVCWWQHNMHQRMYSVLFTAVVVGGDGCVT